LSDTSRQIAELKVERDNLLNSNRTHQIKLKELTEENANLSDSFQQLKETSETITIPTEEDFVPRTTFRSQAFDSNLNSTLEKISVNKSMSVASKIQSSYVEVSKYYNHLIKKREKELETTLNDVQSMRESFNQFLIDLSIILTGNSVTFDQFFDSPTSGTEIVSAAKVLSREVGEAKRLNQLLQSDFEVLKI
jgi:hypothetical protein